LAKESAGTTYDRRAKNKKVLAQLTTAALKTKKRGWWPRFFVNEQDQTTPRG
jgi:hypothetical protein